MLGERSDQRGLWEADQLYLDLVGKGTFYGLLASLRGRLFRDADFAELYCLDNGRVSVPPSLLDTALLLQTHDRVSDAEAKARADFDIRWKVALRIEIEDRPFAKSTLQVFRAQLILHDKVREVFEQSLRLARETGYLKGKRGMRVAMDTTYILGRGAVKDTYNLLADGIVKLMRALSAVEGVPVRRWAEVQGYQRYVGSSVKGEAAIDWSNRRARRRLLGQIVADADRLLELARQAQDGLPADSAHRQAIVEAAELLGQLLLQDVKRGGDGDGDGVGDDDDADGGVSLKDGVSKDRMVSVHDPQMRHGHKSKSRRFDGHKAAVVVDTDSQLITAVDVLAGNAADHLGALELVEQSEASVRRRRIPAVEAIGDTAYGDGGTRQAFADAGRKLVARVPGRPNWKCFPKADFVIDLVAGSCACPAGQTTRTIVPAGKRTDSTGTVHRLQAFRFDGAVCQGCLLRSRCFAAKGMKGRQVLIHPQEGLLQEARALQQSADYDQYRQLRVVAEHRLARLEQLGIRQARYFGRVKTKFQLYLAATVANLTLLANQTGVVGNPGDNPDAMVANAEIGGNLGVDHHLLPTWMLAWLRSPALALSLSPIRAFRPAFSAQICAEHGERNPDSLTHRNGYRSRDWDTRVGTMELRIPKVREGSYFPSLLEPRRRSAKALLAVIQQAYVEGVSTRRVDDLVKSLGCDGISKSQVSGICRDLDQVVENFLGRPLDGGPYPYVWLDALAQKVREGGRIVNVSVVATGVNSAGQREILGMDVGAGEDGAFWLAFLRSLNARGLSGVELVVSDAHQSLPLRKQGD